MLGTLGEMIGSGATAEVYAWAPDRVIKLYKSGVPHRIAKHEAWITRAIHAAGALAPEVFEEVTVEGRAGLVMARVDGLTLMQATKNKTVSCLEAGAILAHSLHSVHATPPPPGLPLLCDYVVSLLDRSPGILSERVAAGVLALNDTLPREVALCHGDPNPGNVIMTSDGPKFIDWIAALRAPAVFDLASAHVMLTELAPYTSDDPERPRAINMAMQAASAELAGASPAALFASMEHFLPLVRALVLLGGGVPALREKLVQRLEADFSS